MEDGKEKSLALKTLTWCYKVLRSLVFTIIVVGIFLFTLLYVGLSIPPVQKIIKERAVAELSTFLGSRVEIENLSISPLNEVILQDAVIYDLQNEKCLHIGKLGAGINIWRLIFRQEIEITYVELLNFAGTLYQEEAHAPLNIDFIIKAFAPKDKNKPPTMFDLKIHNIVLRNGSVTFDRRWVATGNDRRIDFNHLEVENLSADITIPRLSNDDTQIDLRRLSLIEKSGLQIKQISGLFQITPQMFQVENFLLRLPESELRTEILRIPTEFFKEDNSKKIPLNLVIEDSRITPSNLSAFYPPLSAFDNPISIDLSARGNVQSAEITRLILKDEDGLKLDLNGSVYNPMEPDKIDINLEKINLNVSEKFLGNVLSLIPQSSGAEVTDLIKRTGGIDMVFSGGYSAETNHVAADSKISTGKGQLTLAAEGTYKNGKYSGDFILNVPSLDIGGLLPQQKIVSNIENANFIFEGQFYPSDIQKTTGQIDFSLSDIGFQGRRISNIEGKIGKEGSECGLILGIDDNNLNLNVDAKVFLAGEDTKWDLEAQLYDFDTYNSFISEDQNSGYEIKGFLNAHASGNALDNISGTLSLNDLTVIRGGRDKINVDRLALSVDNTDPEKRRVTLQSEIMDFNMEGNYILSKIPKTIQRTLSEVFPLFFPAVQNDENCGMAQFELNLKDAGQIINFFHIPVIPLTELSLNGIIDGENDRIEISTQIPYIQQGASNLITGTYIDLVASGAEKRIDLGAGTVYPTKKGRLKVDLDIEGRNSEYDINIALNRGRNVEFDGDVALKLFLDKDPENGMLNMRLDWLPSELGLNDATWVIEESAMLFNGNELRIDNFCVRHADQFVFISGSNNLAGEGEITVTLADINLDYIFDTLNINYVTFGGNATGGVRAQRIFSANPIVNTEGLVVKNLSYNGSVLGDGDLIGKLDLPARKVAIEAKIHENEKLVAEVDGGVWFGPDSLSFKFDADEVNIGFMQPFMKAFSSDVKGRASGEALLYGTFSDIDMIGKIVAHDTDIMIDYINARYTGSDTVYLKPGRIEIPHFEVKDKMGHTAVVTGELTHYYFHQPSFKFNISEMENLLVYDTNSKINPLWYGRIFASGAGEINGKPGSVNIAADVRTEEGSDFTFVLSDRQEAVKSNFLTFSDKRKEAEALKHTVDTVPDFLKPFQRMHANQDIQESSDIFTMDFRVSVTPDIKFNLIMDPVAGDKITAYGDGAMTLTYTSLTDEMKLYGKYVLDKGDYNFSLQDIILKDFIIKPGSSIAFTGNPYTGTLDITAAYRVNTSLTELDKSFAADRELNRTSVPVEALLKVTGVLTSPNIDFDIDLPTVTEETARKVRSIISTDDMMSRQVLYLVALNKFYPPEYMATSNNGGEWASIASSTLSSQLQNMIGQITDKFTLAPSIRSDKGDFSDIEVDLALSSQLFNNRLLLNGNIGYRDPSNSSTTFVGDFDLEYLLNRKGTWRLKAYNHFNDQNYYLKSALTTQGLGIVWRKDFGMPSLLKKNNNKK